MKLNKSTIERHMKNQQKKWTVPKSITDGISSEFKTSDIKAMYVERTRYRNEFEKQVSVDSPINIDYYLNGDLSIDAYSAFYLPRYSLIPSIALRDLSLHNKFSTLTQEINILDVGSGTGAITLGLLHIFNLPEYLEVKVNITCLDCCKEAETRRDKIIDSCGYDKNRVKNICVDLSDISAVKDVLNRYGKFDFIFTGNCLTELDNNVIDNLLAVFSKRVTQNGAIIIAEAVRNYTINFIYRIISKSRGWDLFPFYPCNKNICGTCWCWREHSYNISPIRMNNDLLLGTNDNLTLNWLILTKMNIHILETYQQYDSNLRWGFIHNIPSENSRDYSACSEGKQFPLVPESILSFGNKPDSLRGSIVGFTDTGNVRVLENL